MSAIKMAAIALVVAGALGLFYGSFSYTRDTHQAKVGALEISLKDKRTIAIPIWVGVGAVVAGGVLLALPRRRS